MLLLVVLHWSLAFLTHSPVRIGEGAGMPGPAMAVADEGPWHRAVRAREAPLDSGNPAAILERARVELSVGALASARELLELGPVRETPQLQSIVLRVRGLVAYADGDFRQAGLQFAAVADRVGDVLAGVWNARAGEAFARAGLPHLAADRYRRAARAVPAIGGWLAIRRAALERDTAVAGALLRDTRPAEQVMAARVWAAVLTEAGDTARAIPFTVLAGDPAGAAGMAAAVGDLSRARRLAYYAFAVSPAESAREAVDLALGRLSPGNDDEVLALSAMLLRLGRSQEAVGLLAPRAGDSGPLLMALGQAQAAVGDRAGALVTFDMAAQRPGQEQPDAAFQHARMVQLVRGADAGVAALTAFAAQYPEHPLTPRALLLLAETLEGRRAAGRADSLYEAIADRWPSHTLAQDGLMRAARRAWLSGQPKRAGHLFRRVADGQGSARSTARLLLGLVEYSSGRREAARETWAVLASQDSVSYSGLTARESAGIPPPSFAVVPWPEPGPLVRSVSAELAALDAVGLSEESAHLLTWAGRELREEPDQVLALARLVLHAGRPERAAALGWEASRRFGVSDPRVLRAVYPWPHRELVLAEAEQFNLDPYLLAGIIRQESTFRPGVTSRAGARGMMQLIPSTAAEVANRLGIAWSDGLLGVPDANLHVGAAHFAALLRYYRQDQVLALAAYNAGGRPVGRWVTRLGRQDPIAFIERIPYPETRGYVQAVVRNAVLYRALYADASAP